MHFQRLTYVNPDVPRHRGQADSTKIQRGHARARETESVSPAKTVDKQSAERQARKSVFPRALNVIIASVTQDKDELDAIL